MAETLPNAGQEVERPKMSTPLFRLLFGVRRCLRRFSMQQAKLCASEKRISLRFGNRRSLD